MRFPGEFRADAEIRFRKVPVERLGQVLEGSGAHVQRFPEHRILNRINILKSAP